MANVFNPPQALDGNGNPIVGTNIWRFFETGTTADLTVFAEEAMTTNLGNVIDTDANGYADPAYFPDNKRLKARLYDAAGNLVKEYEHANYVSTNQSAASGVTLTPSAQIAATNVQDGLDSVAVDLGRLAGIPSAAGQPVSSFLITDGVGGANYFTGQLIRLSGRVDANGAINYGQGFTVNKIATGRYGIIFSDPLPDTNYFVTANLLLYGGDPQVGEVNRTTAGFTIETYTGFALADRQFEFLVIR